MTGELKIGQIKILMEIKSVNGGKVKLVLRIYLVVIKTLDRRLIEVVMRI